MTIKPKKECCFRTEIRFLDDLYRVEKARKVPINFLSLDIKFFFKQVFAANLESPLRRFLGGHLNVLKLFNLFINFHRLIFQVLLSYCTLDLITIVNISSIHFIFTISLTLLVVVLFILGYILIILCTISIFVCPLLGLCLVC